MQKILRPQFVILLAFALTLFGSSIEYTHNKTKSLNIPVWSAGSNIPIPVRAGNTASYSKNGDGWLFIASGRNSGEQIIKTLQRYRVNTNTWDTLAPHPTGLLGGATSVLGDTLYVIGGVINPPGSGVTAVYKYSINQNTWIQAANLPAGVVDAKAVSYQDSIIYIGGGFSSLSAGGLMYMYNSNSNQWRAATPFPSATRRNFGGFAITGDTIVYMCGTAAFGSGLYYDSVYVGVISQINRSVITWTRGANFPGQTRTFFDAHKWGNKGIIMTGGSTDNTFNTHSRECYVFSPGANTWTQLPDKPTSWLTGQSGTVDLGNNLWKLICASGYAASYLAVNEILSDTLNPIGIINYNSEVPEKFSIGQNYPNPFNPVTNIKFDIPKSTHVKLIVYDISGRQAAVLANKFLKAGKYEASWNALNAPSGVYFYKIIAEGFTISKKMILVK